MSIRIFLLLFLVGCVSKVKPISKNVETYLIVDRPSWGTTTAGKEILAGGFSGLQYLGKDEKERSRFLTLTDRGPNGEPTDWPGRGQKLRPFLLPQFTPRLLILVKDGNVARIESEILLRDPAGKNLNGLSYSQDDRGRAMDEVAIDVKGNRLAPNIMGIDPEGVVQDPDGHFWVVEEYRPSIMKFSREGILLKRFIPKNSLSKKVIDEVNRRYQSQVFIERLPEELGQRRNNRGFEGVTFAQGKVYALLQSPISAKKKDKESKRIPLLEFDPKSEEITGQFYYELLNERSDRIGDINYVAEENAFYVIEQNNKVGANGVHRVNRFELKEPIRPVEVLDMQAHGYDQIEKVEGLAVRPGVGIFVVNDNDFGVDGELNIQNGEVPIRDSKSPGLTLFRWPIVRVTK